MGRMAAPGARLGNRSRNAPSHIDLSMSAETWVRRMRPKKSKTHYFGAQTERAGTEILPQGGPNIGHKTPQGPTRGDIGTCRKNASRTQKMGHFLAENAIYHYLSLKYTRLRRLRRLRRAPSARAFGPGGTDFCGPEAQKNQCKFFSFFPLVGRAWGHSCSDFPSELLGLPPTP